MPRATCRCGQTLSFPADAPDRVVCPKCGSKIRVRKPSGAANGDAAGSGSGDGDGFVRFNCPCGRRLKVRSNASTPTAGKCPDCGRVVPVPPGLTPGAPTPQGPETPTQEMTDDDLAALERWAAAHRARRGPNQADVAASTAAVDEDEVPPTEAALSEPAPAPAALKVEAGLRVCPRCGRPVHLSSDTCRQCGAHVPKR